MKETKWLFEEQAVSESAGMFTSTPNPKSDCAASPASTFSLLDRLWQETVKFFSQISPC